MPTDHNFCTPPEILDKIRLLDTRGIELPETALGVKQRQSLKGPLPPVEVNSTLADDSGSRTPLMPHAERQRLIRRPFQSQFRVIAPKSHGGTTLGNSGSVPTEGHRTWQVSPADESYLRYGKFDHEGSE